MPRDGSGNFNLVSGNPVVTNTIISSTTQNNTMNDVAAGLTQSLSRDGQTTPTADIPMGNFKLRSLANALARTDAPNAGQVQDGGLTLLSSVAGTDTITASSAPAITAYTLGQEFSFVPAGANTGSAVTLNINGLGAKSVKRNGTTQLTPGDIPAAGVVSVVYDGTQFQLIAPSNFGRLLNVQVFTSSATYTATVGTTRCIVEMVGGGGGGGGAQTTTASQIALGGGGNAGSFIKALAVLATDNISGQTVTVGASGTAGPINTAGGNGGNSSVGTMIVAPGGAGGVRGAAVTVPAAGVTVNNTTAPSVTGTIKVLESYIGASPQPVAAPALTAFSVSYGASSVYGAGGLAFAYPGGNGALASAAGAGGGSGVSSPSQPGFTGGAGAAGQVIIWEYA